MKNEKFLKFYSEYYGEPTNNIEQIVSVKFKGPELLEFVNAALEKHSKPKPKFGVDWMRNRNYGLGSGTEYFDAENKEEALHKFWEGKNTEAYDVSAVFPVKLEFSSINYNEINDEISLKKNNWIDINDKQQQPKPNTEVLIVCDYTAFGRGRKIYQSNVYFSETPIFFGGPNSLTGQGTLTGIYFALPAIVNPKVVTHWREMPQFP